MQKHNNRYLKPYRTLFAGQDENGAWLWVDGGGCKMELPDLKASSILRKAASIPGESVRVYINVPLIALTRGWFQEPLEEIGSRCKLTSYSHAARSAHFSLSSFDRSVNKSVLIACAENWLQVEDGQTAATAYFEAEANFAKAFGFSFLGSPAQTGLYAVEQSLPVKSFDSAMPSDEFFRTLHANTTQGRTESFLPTEVSDFFYYDRKFAYAADCRLEMPCGREFYHAGDAAAYIPFEPAFYSVIFDVPKDWRHIGLLPFLGDAGWSWPNSGEGYHAFVAEPELRLALSHGWTVKTCEAWRFAKARPLENWRNKLVTQWQLDNVTGNKLGAGIFRKILLHGIGGLYARTFQRERVIDAGELAELNDDEALTAEDTGSGFSVEARVDRGRRFYAPHWAAYTWSRARVVLATRMLEFEPEALIGCHVDAIYAKCPMGLHAVGDAIGHFRCKGAVRLDSPMRLRSQRDLIGLREHSEKGVKDE